MDKLFAREIKGIAITGIIAAGALFYVLWTFFISVSWQLVFGPLEPLYDFDDVGFIVVMMVLAPFLAFWEELWFRLPISIMARWGAPSNAKAQLLFVVVFGLLFGSWHSLVTGSEWFAMIVQGVGGIMLGVVYLWCGGYNGKRLKPIMVTTIIHTCMNWVLYTADLFTLVIGN